MSVYWTSKLEKRRLLWRWDVTIYRKDGDFEIKNHGAAFTKYRAQQKMERWLLDNGELL